MRAVLVLTLLANAACAGRPRSAERPGPRESPASAASVLPGFTLREGESIVYRRLGVADPELHWVERGPDGRLVLGVDDESLRADGRDAMPADLVFPLSDRPVGPEPLRVRREVVVGDLRLQVTEEIRVTRASAGEVTVQFRRRSALVVGDAIRPAPFMEQTGEASFDRASGRYSRIRFEERREDAFGGGSGSAEWEYDEPLSRRRTAARRAPRRALEGRTADAATEIAQIVGGLADRAAPEGTLGFHVHAHPVELWRAVIDHPGAGERFASARPVVDDLNRAPKGDLVELLRSRWAEAAFAHALVARIADERLRPELRLLADGTGPTRGEARLTLQALDLGAHLIVDRWRPLVAVPPRLRAVWQRLSRDPSRDPSPLVPLFIELASGPRTPVAVRDICLEVVRKAGFPSSDPDRRLWRRWWASESTRPWGERLVEAFRAAPPDQKQDAIARLSSGPDTDAARDALAAMLEDESGALRVAAATALARWKDERAARVLVDALDDPSTAPGAFEALGYLADTTLGFDPDGPSGSPARAAALARWRDWARRNGR